MDLTASTAFVTGGSSGIGAAVVEALEAQGARVAVADVAAPEGLTHRPGGGLAVRCDVTDDVSVRAAITAVTQACGGLDMVVNSAGVGAQGDIAANSDEEWHHVYDLNVVGIARVSRAALPHLRASPRASIVNICSVAASIGLPDRALYSASKGAVLALTQAMAADHLGDGIRVNCVSPGTADTPWVTRLLSQSDDPVAERRSLESRQPTGRLVKPEEVASAVVLLLSPLSTAMTGVNIVVDGGLTSLRLPGPPTP